MAPPAPDVLRCGVANAARSVSRWRTLLYVAGTLFTLTFAIAVAGVWFWRDIHSPGSLPLGGALVVIQPGQSFRQAAARLQAAQVIRHSWTVRLWARWWGLDRQLRSGDYSFDHALTPIEALQVLRSPGAGRHRVTIPEGSTVVDVAQALASACFGGADQFVCVARDPSFLLSLDLPASGLEGYLFPDTYAFTWSTNPVDILTAMVARFREQAAGLEEQRVAAGLSTHEMVTVASIIEKETGLGPERALVSAVFRNRLRTGMPLQADPTAVYGRESHVVPSATDLDLDSPYNTYLHEGLPPGPICNPGRAALEAALAPASVDYLYFVARADGTHAFARTHAEHNRNVAQLRQH